MKVSELLKIKYPIFQGAMAQISTHQLAGAVSKAGGLGIIASNGLTPEGLRDEIHALRRMTEKPFGVNLMLLMKNCQEFVEVIVDEKVPIVTTGAGTPKRFMAQFKEAGIKVIPVVPNASIARKMEEIGCDAVIVEGVESGGHIGNVSTLVLLQKVLQTVSIPVIAAGGIAAPNGMAAALAAGASGVQCGTIFLAAKECPVSQTYKEKILQARETDTVVIGSTYKRPLRVVANKMTNEYVELERQQAADDVLQTRVSKSFSAIKKGDADFGAVIAGQSAGLVDEVRSAQEILEWLYEGAVELVRQAVENL
ncbi:2-nitropropane dioxygenase [Enterococcus florum]|uniref:Probable nitronate monooxygenase n=1 Tax=Enterococcus florum TaxID=2480627 RepID=A0A4P5PBQ8_9ENTE|nr:nitronate monooxygenase [Enterococcus florum]GCF92872.1 2-nitropropane dioxygenase [Enterococcus florum]